MSEQCSPQDLSEMCVCAQASGTVGLYELAQCRLEGGQLSIAQNLLTKMVQIYTHMYGTMHADIVSCYK